MSLLEDEKVELYGEAREGRFNSVLWLLHKSKPSWYLGTYQASVHLDLQGVDFIARVIYPKTRGVIEVPIQVKPSVKDFVVYYRKHPYAKGKNIIEMSVPMDRDIKLLVDDFTAHLERARLNLFEYKTYLDWLIKRERDEPHHLELKEMMEDRRKKRPLRLPPCRSPTLWTKFEWWLSE
jgi:hypothetical protein